MKITSITLTDSILEGIDFLYSEGNYINKSTLIRKGIETYLSEHLTKTHARQKNDKNISN